MTMKWNRRNRLRRWRDYQMEEIVISRTTVDYWRIIQKDWGKKATSKLGKTRMCAVSSVSSTPRSVNLGLRRNISSRIRKNRMKYHWSAIMSLFPTEWSIRDRIVSKAETGRRSNRLWTISIWILAEWRKRRKRISCWNRSVARVTLCIDPLIIR